MRYKFRAWDRERNEMRDIKLMDWSDWWVSTGSTWERDKPSEYGERNSFSNEETDRHVLMQFTGLTDRNGKEIYEGDIVHFSDGLKPQFVKWVGWMAGFAMALNDKSGTTGIPADCEVIGNIHENPELLGGTIDAGLSI